MNKHINSVDLELTALAKNSDCVSQPANEILDNRQGLGTAILGPDQKVRKNLTALEQQLLALPKIELHCHLDGSLIPTTLWKLAQSQGIDSSLDLQSFKQKIIAPANCPDLKTYLERFTIPCACLQSFANLERAAYELLQQAKADNIIYIEMRYAPSLHINGDLDREATVQAVLSGIKKGEADFNIKASLLLCALRGLDEEEGQLAIVRLAHKYRDQGVVGIDLAGDEAAYPLSLYRNYFSLAKELGVQCTIHTGECGDINNFKYAVDYGASRVGHGVLAATDAEVLAFCRQAKLFFEFCPTSNYQTKAWLDIKTHPVISFSHNNIPCALSTDNRTVSDTTLNREFLRICEVSDLSLDDFQRMQKQALAYAFCDSQTKQELAARLDSCKQI